MMCHNVNCTKCGEKISAGRMAINLDRLMDLYAEKMLDREPDNAVYARMRRILSDISPRLYFAYDDLVAGRRLDESNNLVLDGEGVLRLMQDKHGIDLTGEAGGYAVSEKELDALAEKMGTQKDIRVKWEDKKQKIRELTDLLLENTETVFLDCRVEARKEPDDMGNTIVTYIKCRIGGEQSDVMNMVCPVCGGQFLLDAGKYREEVILLMGSARVGKTAYLAALIDFLGRENAKKKLFPLVMGTLEDEKGNFFRENILKAYQAGKPIEKTNISNEEMVPLASFLLGVCGKKVIVTFIDMPGEAYSPAEEEAANEKYDFIANKRRACKNASAYILCIAPEQIDMVIKEKEKEKGGADSAADDIDKILENIAHSVKLVNMKSAETPTAVVLTKSDKIKDYNFYDPNERFEDLIEVNEEGQFFLADKYRQITEEIGEYLDAGHVKPVEGRIKSIFNKFNYFTVASYGAAIGKAADGESKPRPSGIILPFLWVMTMLGYFRPARNEYETRRYGFLKKRSEMVPKRTVLETDELVRK